MVEQRVKFAKVANGSGVPKTKGPKNVASLPPAGSATSPNVEDKPSALQITKPDKAAYDLEQQTLKDEIAKLQARVNAIQSQLNSNSPKNDQTDVKKEELKVRQQDLRTQMDGTKQSREPILAQLKALNESIAKKGKELAALKSKSKGPYKSVEDVNTQIQQLEKQVDSGIMKLADEKRALGEITNLKRLRKTLEKFEADQRSIDIDRATANDLRSQLDDPKSKALSSGMDSIKAELEAIRKEDDVKYAGRKVLVDERNQIKAQLDELFQRKRESAQNYKTANDRYWTKVQDDRARRAERARAQKVAEEESKKAEIANQLREEAATPAYQSQIEDCQTLIDYFSGRASGTIKLSTSNDPVLARNELAGVPKLELRQVEIDEDLKGLVPRKKKGDEEEAYFVGGGGKKGKKGGSSSKGTSTPVSAPSVAASPSGSGTLQVPLPTLAALLVLSIPPPSSQADVPRLIEDLHTKKAWFEANQKRSTEENVARAEEEIRKLFNEDAESAPAGSQVPADEDGGAQLVIENEREPSLTPAAEIGSAVPDAADKVDEELERDIEA